MIACYFTSLLTLIATTSSVTEEEKLMELKGCGYRVINQIPAQVVHGRRSDDPQVGNPIGEQRSDPEHK